MQFDAVYILLVAVVAFAIVACARPLAKLTRAAQIRQGLARFPVQREQLEARFFALAASLGKPRGLRWVECDWQPNVAFARDPDLGLLTAFVGVNIRFEAVEGGDMEDVEAVGLIRDATAVFHYRHGTWGTGGRALFNMNPSDAVQRLEGQYERIAVDDT